MNIDKIITRQEYESTTAPLDYDKFCDYMERIVKLCVEESLKALPQVITYLVHQSSHIKDLSKKFYEENKDLVSYKQIVAKQIEKIEGENPGLEYAEVLHKAAIGSRQIISNINKVTNFNPKHLDRFDDNLRKLK